MDLYGLLTSSTCSNWLPGDMRGFVGEFEDARGVKVLLNAPGTDFARDIPKLREFARGRLEVAPIMPNAEQAETMLRQFYLDRGKRFAAGAVARAA